MLSSTLRYLTLAAVLSISLLSAQTEAASKGLAWGTDNRWAKKIAKGQVAWYHHWQNGPVSTMPNDVNYIAMYWGPKYNHLWAERKKWIKKHNPKYVLAFNEPDVKGQANLSPSQAASLWMKELEPLRKKGIKVSSPQIVWNTKWMDSFLKKIRARGSDVDFIGAHYYGSWKDQKRLQKWMKTLHKKYKKNIWLTEYGVTSASHGSADQIRNFKTKVTNWMDKQSYIDRVAWLGCFATNNPPDAYASANNGMFTSSGQLNKMGHSYVYSKRDTSTSEQQQQEHVARSAAPHSKRQGMHHHKRIIANGIHQVADLARRNESEVAATPAEEDDASYINGIKASKQDIEDYLAAQDDNQSTDDDVEEDDCDEMCRMREEQAEEEGILADDDDDDE